MAVDIDQLLRAAQEIARNTAPEWYRPYTDFGLAAGTIALAAFTALLFRATTRLASATAQLAIDTVAASTLTDIHHQESQAPLIVWDGTRQLRFETLPGSKESRFIQVGYIRNVGFGPALQVTVHIYFETGDPIVSTFGTFSMHDRIPETETRSGYVQGYLGDRKITLRIPTRVEFTYVTSYGRNRRTSYHSPEVVAEGPNIDYFFYEETVDLNRDERVASLTELQPVERIYGTPQ